MNGALESLTGAKTVLLRTFKRDGTPVPTPVSIAFDGDRAFFRSYDQALGLPHAALRVDPTERAC